MNSDLGGKYKMAKKQFKAESKKLLDMMINSIYTHKEIFLREAGCEWGIFDCLI